MEEPVLTREELDKYINQIVVARQLVKIPIKERELAQKGLLKNTLNELNSKYVDIFKTMNHYISNRLFAILESDDFAFIDDYQEYLDKRAFEPPKVSKNASEQELKEALSDIYKDQVTIKGILAVVTPLCREINLLKEKAESAVKGVMFMEDNQWGADSVFHMMFPEEIWDAYAKLESLKVAYELKEEQFDSAFELISRLVTIELTMPTDEPRRRRREPEESGDEESEPKATQSKVKSKRPGRWSDKLS